MIPKIDLITDEIKGVISESAIVLKERMRKNRGNMSLLKMPSVEFMMQLNSQIIDREKARQPNLEGSEVLGGPKYA